jgi:hypothetical protein
MNGWKNELRLHLLLTLTNLSCDVVDLDRRIRLDDSKKVLLE